MNVMYFSRTYNREGSPTEEMLHEDVADFFLKIATEEDGSHEGVVNITLELEEEQDQ